MCFSFFCPVLLWDFEFLLHDILVFVWISLYFNFRWCGIKFISVPWLFWLYVCLCICVCVKSHSEKCWVSLPVCLFIYFVSFTASYLTVIQGNLKMDGTHWLLSSSDSLLSPALAILLFSINQLKFKKKITGCQKWVYILVKNSLSEDIGIFKIYVIKNITLNF